MIYVLFTLKDGFRVRVRDEANHDVAVAWYKAAQTNFYCNESDYNRMDTK